MQETTKLARLFPQSPATAMDWALIAVPGIIWGSSFLFIAEGMRAIGPNGLTFVRILLGFATLSLFPSARRPVERSDRAGIAWLGVLWLAFPLSMFALAEQRVSSALTGMLNGANPLFTAVVAALLARRAPSRRVLIGLVVGMAGTIVVALAPGSSGPSSAAGIAMIAAALLSYGAALNLARPLQQRNGALPVIWRAQMVALVLTAPLGLPELIAARWMPGPAIALLALGSLGTGLAHAVMSVAAGKLGATRAASATFLIPAVALVLGVLCRHERVALLAVMGSFICIAGAWFMRRVQNSGERQPKIDRGSEQPLLERVSKTVLYQGMTSEAAKKLSCMKPCIR
jgi:drug/metabolite transporter (DMT)-like permease